MMNKRIRELAKQSYEKRKRVIPNLPIGEAWIEFDAEGRPTNLPDELVFNKEKFAELIVKECIKTIPIDIDPAVYLKVLRAIDGRFGVE